MSKHKKSKNPKKEIKDNVTFDVIENNSFIELESMKDKYDDLIRKLKSKKHEYKILIEQLNVLKENAK